MPIWAAEAEMDEDLQEVDLSHAIGNYVQNELYDEGISQCSPRYMPYNWLVE